MQTTVAKRAFIGVDVSKDTLVSCDYGSGKRSSLLNQRGSIESWLKGLPADSVIGMEATSTYHELLANLAYRRSMLVHVLNPKDVHRYAKGVGMRAKTDRVDAALIARYIAHEHTKLHAYRPPSPEQRQLKRLLTRRAQLSCSRAGVKQSLQGLSGLKRPLLDLLKGFDALIAVIDARIGSLVNTCPQRQHADQRLRSITGIGKVVSPALLTCLEQFAFRKADSFVAYLGFDLCADDSGQRSGRRRLSKDGPSELRRLVYIAAMAAVKSPHWKALYQRYLNKVHSRTAALVIIARKIARTAWSVYTHNTTFDPKRISLQA